MNDAAAMKRIVGLGALVLVATTTTAAHADRDGDPEPTSTGIELGLRSGFALPFGKGVNSDVTPGQVPFQLDVGYRITPSIAVGALVQYGVVLLKSSRGCDASGVSCSAHDIVFGGQIHYHGAPEKTLDPWVGLGLGYEIFTESVSAGNQDLSLSFKGFQFAKMQLGADYRVNESFAVGPFIDFSIGMYTSASIGDTSGDINDPKPHEWLTFGLRGVLDISPGGHKESERKTSQKERESTTTPPETAETAPPPAANPPPAASDRTPPPQKGVSAGEAGAWPASVPIADRGTCSFVCIATDGAAPREADKVALAKALDKHLGALRACVAPNGGKSSNAVIVSFNPGGNATVNYSFEQRTHPRADCPGSFPPVRGISGPPNSTWKCTDYCE